MSTGPWSLVVCVDNRGVEASLVVGKVYRALEGTPTDRDGFLRVVDESGEDYLFPQEQFVPIDVGETARRRIVASLDNAVPRTRI